MSSSGNILISDVSPVLHSRLTEKLENVNAAEVFEDKFVEFWGWTFLVKSDAASPHRVRVAVGLPADLPAASAELYLSCVDHLASVFTDVATVSSSNEEGYHLALDLDMLRLSSLEPQAREAQVHELSCLRRHIMCHPLRCHLQALVGGAGSEYATQLYYTSANSGYYVKQHPDSLTVVLPVNASNAQDSAIATAFLQEFSSTQRTAGLSSAPSVTYYSAKSPPGDVAAAREGAAAALSSPSCGFVQWRVSETHAQGARGERLAWQLACFQPLIQQHVKACMSWMHTRMRRRVDVLVQQTDTRRGSSGSRTSSPVKRSLSMQGTDKKDNTPSVPTLLVQPTVILQV